MINTYKINNIASTTAKKFYTATATVNNAAYTDDRFNVFIGIGESMCW